MTSRFRVIWGLALAGTALAQAPSRVQDQREKPEVQFVSFALDDIQKNWDRVLPEQTKVPYRHAKLVLFRDEFPSACGEARRAVGPFYCPSDEKVYLDLGFFSELSRRFGATGKFAQAYVLAHEIGHHVQKLLGTETRIRHLEQENPSRANDLSVRLELQADCFAGVWAHSTRQRDLIDQRDIGSALRAAAAVGDDRLQRMQTGRVHPESFTHGTSQQRMNWFRRGMDAGKIADCNTF
jgi:predicted metalloprotease